MSPFILYSPEELLARPIEHTMEFLSCRDLAQIIACDRSTANDIIRGKRGLGAAEAERVRVWLAHQAGVTTMTAETSVPLAAGRRYG